MFVIYIKSVLIGKDKQPMYVRVRADYVSVLLTNYLNRCSILLVDHNLVILTMQKGAGNKTNRLTLVQSLSWSCGQVTSFNSEGNKRTLLNKWLCKK